MSHLTLTDAVADYARAVRAHLADLGPELVDDLPDGLEADLAEAIVDGDGTLPVATAAPTTFVTFPEQVPDSVAPPSTTDLTARFGTPSAYAAELRAAAGLAPSADAASPAPFWAAATTSGKDLARRGAAPLTRARWWPGVREFLVALRPLWWVLRGWLAGALVLAILTGGDGQIIYQPHHEPSGIEIYVPVGILEAMVLGLGVVASVQYGRGSWVLRGRWNTVGVLASVGAAITVIPVVITVGGEIGRTDVRYEYIDNPDYSAASMQALVGEDRNALIAGGERVRNLFVYGPDGEYIDGAQIVDQDGRPLLLTPDGSMWEPETETQGETSSYWVPREDVHGRQVWNAYPLGYWTSHMAEWDEDAQTWVLPAGIDPWPKAPVISSLPGLRTPDAAQTDGTDEPGDIDAQKPAGTPTGESTDKPADDDEATPTDEPTGETTDRGTETKKPAGAVRTVPGKPTLPVRSVPQGTASGR